MPAGVRLAAWSQAPAEIAQVRRRGLADLATGDLAEAVRDADLVVLCTPVGAMARVAADFAPHLAAGAAVTDVGSVKAAVVAALGPLFPDAGGSSGGTRFVGGHPMAGRELAGLDAARAGLFAGASFFLTPAGATAPGVQERVAGFWQALGVGRIQVLPAAEHDALVALISHLPHLVAAALLETVATAGPPEALACSGPGLRSVTRPAAGSPALLDRDSEFEPDGRFGGDPTAHHPARRVCRLPGAGCRGGAHGGLALSSRPAPGVAAAGAGRDVTRSSRLRRLVLPGPLCILHPAAALRVTAATKFFRLIFSFALCLWPNFALAAHR